MVGNEFVDALPVHLVDVTESIPRELWVAWDGSFALSWGELSAEAATEMEILFGSLDLERLRDLTRDGVIEVRPGVSGLLTEVAEAMPTGSLVTIDYGEWLDDGPGSRRRTARGYFRHQTTADLLERVGRQDLTADVDFRALDLHGRQAGFETVVFATLAAFLAAGGAGQELVTPCELPRCLLSDPLEADRQASVLGALLDEQGLGGSFKVMVQVRE
jgi:SAM-dependent MidA family methyltransferase